MRQLILHVPDAQMLALEEAAKNKDRRPEDLIAEGLTSLMTGTPDKRNTSLQRSATYLSTAKVEIVSTKSSALSRLALKRSRLTSKLPSVQTRSYRLIKNGASYMLVLPEIPTPARTPAADERSRRRDVLKQTAGIWKDRNDVPKDGLEYQGEARTEWD